MAAKKSRILVACVQEAYTRLFAIFTGHELTFVTTLADAQTALRADHFNVIMIGVNFDESRMFDLLQHVRADSKLPGARGLFSGVSVELFKSFASLCAAGPSLISQWPLSAAASAEQ